jgi:hypothetical protein
VKIDHERLKTAEQSVKARQRAELGEVLGSIRGKNWPRWLRKLGVGVAWVLLKKNHNRHLARDITREYKASGGDFIGGSNSRSSPH